MSNQEDIVPQRNRNMDEIKLSSETERELEHFSKMSKLWWDVDGLLKPLHKLNIIRVPFICDGLMVQSPINSSLSSSKYVLENQKILEVGCGAGILTEDLAKLGATVTALDLSYDLINTAREHLHKQSDITLKNRIQYKLESVEIHARHKSNYYDAVVVSEVLEHIDDKVTFLRACVQCLKPGGSIFITTLSKTIAMWLYGVLVLEYILNRIPVGTHRYDLLISPAEVQTLLETMNCSTVLVKGSTYNFWNSTWKWINSTKLFYALHAVKSK